jgi:hypothetical protein
MGDALALATVAFPKGQWFRRDDAIARVFHFARLPRGEQATARGLLQQLEVHGLVSVRSGGLFKQDEYALAERVAEQTPEDEPKDRTVYEELTDENGRVNKFVFGSPEAASEKQRLKLVWQAKERDRLGL